MHNLEGWGLQKHYNNYPPPPLMYAVDKVRIDTLTMKKYDTHKIEIYFMVLQFTRHKVQSFDASFSLFSISCIVFRTISPENLGCSEKDTKCHSLWQHIETETGTNCSTIFWKLKCKTQYSFRHHLYISNYFLREVSGWDGNSWVLGMRGQAGG